MLQHVTMSGMVLPKLPLPSADLGMVKLEDGIATFPPQRP